MVGPMGWKWTFEKWFPSLYKIARRKSKTVAKVLSTVPLIVSLGLHLNIAFVAFKLKK